MIPPLTEFNPFVIPWQGKLITDIRKNFDYRKGTHEVLMSGSVGSAKSAIMAHVIVTHCLLYPKAKALVTRRSLPDLKSTIWAEIIDHIEGCLVENQDYKINRSELKITFSNGSEILTRSFADGRIRKFRSLILSLAAIEELTENDDMEFYKEIRMRVGRATHVPEHLVVSATNPASPSHPAYDYFIKKKSDLRKVYYSVTSDNPFLPKTYIEGLRDTLSPKEARRMLYGEWIELSQDVVYYNYASEKNFVDEKKQLEKNFPIDLMFDFNIAAGKPMSAAIGQHINGIFHVIKTFIIEGARTLDILEEMDFYGVFKHRVTYRIFGDATGRSRDTRSIRSDYDVIEQYLSNKVRYEMLVPRSNPPVRKRHNLVNAMCENDKGSVKMFLYKEAEQADRGFRLTKLRKNANYIEDDSFEFQHVTTAIGYWICFCSANDNRISKTIQL